MRLKIRGLISLGLLLFWGVSALSGIILYLAPEGQRSGRTTLLFNLTKHGWSEFHTWASFVALGITVLHIVVDWKILVAVIKYLVKGNIPKS